MEKIVVTGANGQLGCELRNIAADGARFSWLFTDLGELDIADGVGVEAFFEREHPSAVVNCAAWTDVDGAETARQGAFRVNRDAVAVLAAAARRFDAALVHVSTDFVFGGRRAGGGFSERTRPYTEEEAPAPLNVYGDSKLAGERAVWDSGCRGAVIRTSWLYSPYGRNFVKSILGAASRNAEIRVVADQRGNPTAADGLAAAIAGMLPELIPDPRPARIYHYCDAGAVSRAEFAEEIIRQAKIDCKVIPVSSSEYPMAAARPAYSALDTAKITRDFGITPRPWQQALTKCMGHLK